MSSFANKQGNKKDFTHQKSNPSRGNNKKWGNNATNNPGNSTGRSNNGSSGSNATTPTATTTNNNTTPMHNKRADEDVETMRLMHDRMLFLLSNLTGSVVQITVKNGVKFEGVFHGASTEGGDIGVSLKHARKIHDPQASQNEKSKVNPYPVKPSMLIMGKDLVEIYSPDTDLTAGDDSFKTDTDISGRMEIKERELFKWKPEEGASEFGALEGEEVTDGQNGSWDQFAANEKLFGLKTDFDEEIYTTRLDRSAPDFKDRERLAIEKANEIQRSAANNVHVMEERGIAIDDSGMDEEDRYAGVVRDTNKYMPPALRKQMQAAARKDDKKVESNNNNNNPLQNIMTTNIPKAVVTTASPVTHLPNTRQDGHDKKSTTTTTTTTTTATTTATTTGTKLGPDGQPKRIENEIAHTFRQFAMQEKDKLHAKKQALQKKEKEDRLAELMKFHQTFKLNVPVPADLVPLLSKGKKSGSPGESLSPPSVPAEVPKKQQPSEEKKSEPVAPSQPSPTKEQEDAIKTVPAPAPAVAAAKKETLDKSKSPFKFNVKATEFKPNPSAPVFVPGGSSGATTPGGAKSVSGGDGSPFFAGRQLKKGTGAEQLTIAEAFTPPFAKGKEPVTPNSIGPTWPFGTKQYKYHFNQYNNYEEEMFGGYGSPGYPYGYPQYRYAPQYVQAPMAMQQTGHPYMSPQQFVHNVPLTGAPMPHAGAPPAVAYSPQMANVSPHGSPFPQGFPSPQRSPIVPHGVPPHQVYQYQGNGPHVGPGPVIMQRPMMMDPNQVHYPPQQEQPQPPPPHHGVHPTNDPSGEPLSSQ
ncbi:hypothetical protein BDA99DRAFT_508021 [Phascolomyces articulosus]|uniref:LsmAD domain-containing protein n=1 Tax=Phascolomyces articulosus TaxID=60185 RepID=A0AAD5KCD9_9FUNG|nr:hypothetical protein BDA99DRAFT_508021 [Phascolomyces articulosus]